MKLLQLQHQDAPRTQNSESRAQNPELRTRAAMFKVAHAAAARPRKTIKTHNLAGGNRMGESGILEQDGNGTGNGDGRLEVPGRTINIGGHMTANRFNSTPSPLEPLLSLFLSRLSLLYHSPRFVSSPEFTCNDKLLKGLMPRLTADIPNALKATVVRWNAEIKHTTR